MQILNKDNWHGLMLSSLAGDKADYRLLLGEIKIWLEAFFRKRVHHDAVDDLVQETLLAIHNKKQTFDIKREFMPWLIAVARHKWIDRIRKNLRYIEVELDAEFASEINTGISARYDVQKLLNTLPYKQAQIIEMVKLQELTNEEVA
jgi:RNA polymerase sigma-70 factor (ECF subfamily)